MASEIQDILRLLTSGRNKLSMMAAMGRVKALQVADIRSVASIATADLVTLKDAIGDEKAAKQLQAAAKTAVKDPSKKRNATESLTSADAKRKKSAYEFQNEPVTPQALEASLVLPTPSSDEEEISKTTIQSNRAPLVLAFAVALLKYTMPEQPLSSRLSLAQAVVSVNSRSKASSLGITKEPSAEQDGWGHGQPKVRIMGREVHVLKRGGYEWKDPKEEQITSKTSGIKDVPNTEDTSRQLTADTKTGGESADVPLNASQWAVSQSVTLKKSTFVARSIGITSPRDARSKLQELMAENQTLRDASHNIVAWRVQGDHSVIEECNDDGESGGGRHILQLLQSTNLLGVLIVCTRWYGGIMLGTDRWRLMSEVCRDSLSQRLRITGILGQEALWGLDLEGMRSTDSPVVGRNLPIYKSESARAYIMKAFASLPAASETPTKKKKTGAVLELEKEHNLGLLLGALDLLYGSWVEHISRDELDYKAWSWYVQVRPQVDSGISGWGAKGDIKLVDILNLRRKG